MFEHGSVVVLSERSNSGKNLDEIANHAISVLSDAGETTPQNVALAGQHWVVGPYKRMQTDVYVQVKATTPGIAVSLANEVVNKDIGSFNIIHLSKSV